MCCEPEQRSVITEASIKRKINIDDECYETYPCQHEVSIDNAPKKLMSGVEIVDLLTRHNQEIPAHFRYLI